MKNYLVRALPMWFLLMASPGPLLAAPVLAVESQNAYRSATVTQAAHSDRITGSRSLLSGRSAPVSTTEIQHAIFGQFAPMSAWRGTVSTDQSLTKQGTAVLRRTGSVSFSVWRNVCDIGGCIETVLSASHVPIETSSWRTDFIQGWVRATKAPVSVTRWRVDPEALTPIDSKTLTLPLTVSMHTEKSRLDQSISARSPRVVTASRTRQVSARVTLKLGDVALQADDGSAVLTTILTTMEASVSARSR